MSSTPQHIDRYEILGDLGQGGFGAVYRARHSVLGTEVALKVLAAHHATQAGMVERFLREAQLAAAIGNPHIVGVSDAGVTEDGLPFLAMELLLGQDLEQYIVERGALPISEAVGIMQQTLSGLGAAHAARIVHRDLKPANLFICRDASGEPLLKILDFGISKVFEPGRVNGLTKTGAVLGTPAYMAPEQLQDSSGVDLRADLYAAGAILFESLTGELPYDSGSFADLMARVQGRAPARLDRLLPGAPPALTELIDRALQRDPAQRFQSAEQMASALEAATRGVGSGSSGSSGPRGTALLPAGARPVWAPETAGGSNVPTAPRSQPAMGGHSPTPYSPTPYPPSAASFGAAPAPPPPAWSAPPSYGASAPGASSHGGSLAYAPAKKSSAGLWIGLAAVGVVLCLTCVGAGALALMLSAPDGDDATVSGMDGPRPGPSSGSTVPSRQPQRPSPPPPTPADPRALVSIPEGAEPCAVPVSIDVECDRQFEEQLPLNCEAPGGRELIVLAAYRPQRYDNVVEVHLARTAGPILLVLSSYGAVDWALRLEDGVELDAIYLVGRGHARVIDGVPAGLQVRHGNGYPIMGWRWGGGTWSGETTASRAESDTGQPLRAYVGCYNPASFFVGQRAPAP